MFDLGLVLKGLRKRNNYTQKQVARRLNVSATTVGRWENNYKRPSTEHLIDLSVLFNVPLNYLIGLEKEKAIVIDGLEKSQQELIRLLVLEFESDKKKSKELTQRQQAIINLLFKEFHNKIS